MGLNSLQNIFIMSFKYEKNPFKHKSNIYSRIFISDMSQYIHNLSDFDDFEKFHKKTIDKNIIFSEIGCFTIKNDKIYKIEYVDNPIIKKTIEHSNQDNEYFKYDFILDDSKEILKEGISQIPYNHALKNFVLDIYSVNEKSNVKLVIVKENNSILEFYFEIFDNIEHKYIKDDLFTLLSCIN